LTHITPETNFPFPTTDHSKLILVLMKIINTQKRCGWASFLLRHKHHPFVHRTEESHTDDVRVTCCAYQLSNTRAVPVYRYISGCTYTFSVPLITVHCGIYYHKAFVFCKMQSFYKTQLSPCSYGLKRQSL